jgi:hypothetical protein
MLSTDRGESRVDIEAGYEGAGLWRYYRANEAWLSVMAEGIGHVAPRIVEAIADVTAWAKFQGMADTTTDVEMKRYYQRAANEALIRFDEGMAAVKDVFEALGSVR